MPSKPTEKATVQDPLLKYAQQVKWDYIAPEEALVERNGETGLVFRGRLKDKLLELNPDILDEELAERVIKRIENAKNSIEGNQVVLQFLKGVQTIFIPSEKREMAVRLIDFDDLGNNDYQVTDEWRYTNGTNANRADVIFLINGLPVIIVETKSARKQEGVAEAITQLRRYEQETPELMLIPQVFDATHLLDFYYGVTWGITRKNLFNWKDVEKGNFEKRVKSFFDRERILRLLKDYIIFTKKDDNLQKVILRQHQTRAVEKVVERALDKKRRRGLIWHTQGSGKTYTMITSAKQLLRIPELEKPTILMLVDRNELESQLFNNLEAYGFGQIEVAHSKSHLQQLLSSDYRGLLVTMIHKFEGIPADLNKRKNIIVLVDEAHRTTSGDLGNFFFACIPNATFIGFTGTPIDQIAYGKGTFKVFGTDDDKGYLDKYSIAESIEDGTTLPLNYSLAPNEMLVDKELLRKEFLELAEAQGVSDIEELNKILEKAVNLRNFLKAKDRIPKVAKFVAKHYKENVEPLGYKAFLVGVDREACALYKQALDKFLPTEYSTVVYTSMHNDGKLLKQFALGKDAEKKVRKAFIKRDTLPKILIVTEKLLTGYDAPILYAMYLDKPMRDHTLLQAIARVNRPYETEDGVKKPYGFVLDFVGIFDKLEKALAFDSDEVQSVIRDLDLLKQLFAGMMIRQSKAYHGLMQGRMNDKTVENAIEYFHDQEKRAEFFKFYKELESLYEIISPDVFVRPYVEDYILLSQLYAIIRNAFAPKVFFDKEFLNKTEALVRKKVQSEGLEATLPVYKIDDKLVEILKNKHRSPTVRVINLIKSIEKDVEEGKASEPYLIDIAERAERIREMFENRQEGTREALAELENLIKEIIEARQAKSRLNLDIKSFTVFWILKEAGLIDHEDISRDIAKNFDEHPNWFCNSEEMRKLKTLIYKYLLQTKAKDKVIEIADRLFAVQEEVRKQANV